MKIKAAVKDNKTIVKVLIKHPMETGRRKDETTGELVPEKFITELTCTYDDRTVFIAYLSQSVSKNPYLSFSFNGARTGDKIFLTWKDSTGETLSTEAEIR